MIFCEEKTTQSETWIRVGRGSDGICIYVPKSEYAEYMRKMEEEKKKLKVKE